MLPLQQTYEVKESILEYIRTSYHFKEDAAQKALYDFIEDPVKGMIKGPYISLKASFVSAPAGYTIPLDINPGFIILPDPAGGKRHGPVLWNQEIH